MITRSGSAVTLNSVVAVTSFGMTTGANTVALNDLIVVGVAWSSSGTSSGDVLSAPSGFTKLSGDDTTQPNSSLDVCYKYAASGDVPGSVSYTFTLGRPFAAIMQVYRGVDASTPFTPTQVHSTVNNTAVVLPSVTTTRDWSYYMAFIASNSSLNTMNTSMSGSLISIADVTNGGSSGLQEEELHAIKTITPIGSSGTFTVNSSNPLNQYMVMGMQPFSVFLTGNSCVQAMLG